MPDIVTGALSVNRSSRPFAWNPTGSGRHPQVEPACSPSVAAPISSRHEPAAREGGRRTQTTATRPCGVNASLKVTDGSAGHACRRSSRIFVAIPASSDTRT